MRSDTLIMQAGYDAIFNKLDIVEGERFITLLKRNNFDYTEWRQNLFEDMSVEELSRKAQKYYEKNNIKA